MIFLRKAENAETSRRLKLCLVAMCLACFDDVEWINKEFGMNIGTAALNGASDAYGALAIRSRAPAHFRNCIPLLRSLMGGLL